ncbi:hypothetical protein AA0242T_2073 [Acetobacter aceti NRIC 0242]|uniref:Uncharacterized protein n=1 Tax=Acetobacter aceti NBRC 14818 TaxID=887700 RepID=A0AB33IBI4_ACEAC|nr:hypothetical protein [Acetobacter aceti]TCS34288.1 hypothetical protein EDC15_104234 [Acetobacter aceti NBRC 14818]BCK75426.1 hypothetical protein EMQ_1032 [Acetobacter aceti NBRC 14818]GAN58679.1 hypothetical protein Abac_063_014 [Acetobacter aceti NBRC 14818]GBO81371.1 hypothetical protein AA0242T_2073 [Acetobacter aceti NRIC 0242]
MRHLLRLAVIAAGSAAALSASPVLAASSSAESGPASVYDLSVLPSFSGTVTQYIPSAGGGVTGLLLSDGMQVLVSQDLSWDIPKIVKPGEKITGTGLKGKVLPIIQAFSLSGPRGSRSEDVGIAMPQHSPEMVAGPDIVVHGEITHPLYNIQGVLIGAILKDHTVIRIPTRDAAKIAAWLKPGAMLYAAGPGATGVYGTAINAHQIGPDAQQLLSVTADDLPPPGPPPGSAGYDVIKSAETH